MIYAKNGIGGLKESRDATEVNARFQDTVVDLPLNQLLRTYGDRLQPLLGPSGMQAGGSESDVYVVESKTRAPSKVVKILKKNPPDWEIPYRTALHALLHEDLGEDQMDHPGFTMRRLPSGITVVEQELITEGEIDSGFPFCAGNAEKQHDLSAEAYRKVSEGLIALYDGYQFDRDEFLHVQGRADLERTLKGAEKSWEVRVRLMEYVRGFMKFLSRDMGAYADFAQEHNLIMTYYKGELHMRDIDGIHPDMDVGSKLPDALMRFTQRDAIGSDQNVLIPTLNAVRLLNALTMRLGMPERLNIIPQQLLQSKGIKDKILNIICHPASLFQPQKYEGGIDFDVMRHQLQGGTGRPEEYPRMERDLS